MKTLTPANPTLTPKVKITPACLAWRLLLTAQPFILLALLAAPATARQKDTLWQTYTDMGVKADERKDYAEAEKFYKLAQARASEFGETDERALSTLIRLVTLYLKWEGKDAEAEPLHKQIVARLDKGAGADSLSTASSVSSLGTVYQNMRRYKDAEPLHRHALEIYRKSMKPDDMSVVHYLFNLGGNYLNQGRHKEAKKIFIETVDLLDRHPELSTQSNAGYARGYLVLILRNEREYEEGEKYGKRSLEIIEKYRGPNHPELADMLKAMHLLYRAQERRQADSEAVMIRAIKIDELAYGPASRRVAQDIDFLATAYSQWGRFGDAQAQYQRELDILEQVADVKPSEIFDVAINLASALYPQRRYEDGLAVCKRLRVIFEKKFAKSPEHHLMVSRCFDEAYFESGNYVAEAEALTSAVESAEKLGPEWELTLANKLSVLGSSYVRQQKYAEALAALQRAEKIYAKKSATPPLLFLNTLARVYYFLGRYDESEALLVKVIAMGEEDKSAAGATNAAWFKKNYAVLLYARGKTAQAEEMFNKAVEVLKSDKATGERDAATSWHDLALLFTKQGKYAEAEPLFRRAMETREKALGTGHGDFARSLEDYAALMRKTGRADEAAAFEERARAIRAKQAAQ